MKTGIVATMLVAGGLAVSGPVLAQQKDTGWYIGGGFGSSRVNFDTTAVNSAITSVPGITSAVTTDDESDTGWKLFGGYQINRNFAAEVSYANLGKFSTVTTTTPAATFNGEVKVENTWSFDLLGIVPLQNNFSFFGRAGLLYAETKGTFSGVGPGGSASISNKDNDWNYKLGLGVGYDFNNQVGVRGEWERYRVPDGFDGHGDLDLWSVSLRFKFF